MVNKFKEINWNPNRAERKKFALTLMAGFPFMGLMLAMIGRLATGAWKFQVPAYVAGVGFGVAVVLWLLPGIALPFYRLWFSIICVVDFVVTHVVLVVLYYLVICPAGLVYQLFRPSSFQKRIDKRCVTYFRDVPPVQDVRRYYRQF